MRRKHFSKTRVATIIAVILHIVGLVGIIAFNSDFIIRCTPFNLLACFALLIWTQKERNRSFLFFTVAVCLLGFIIEIIGVNTGYIFGTYSYGTVLGPGFMGVPFMIGINWFIIIYCCGIATYTLLARIVGKFAPLAGPPQIIRSLSLIVDGATIATILDWLMEPSVVRLEFWQWGDDGTVPLYNYLCWFVTSMALLVIFKLCKFRKRNKFAVNLLFIQIIFFLVLRIYLDN